MVNTILVTGGAASGKSRWAVTRLAPFNDVLFLDTHEKTSSNVMERIRYGNSLYGVDWEIKTGVTDMPHVFLKNHAYVIFDSLDSYAESNLVAMCPNVLEITDDLRRKIQKKVVTDIELLHKHARNIGGCVIITTLETGFSVTPQDPFQRELRGIIGSINQRIANISDEVYFSASGIQVKMH